MGSADKILLVTLLWTRVPSSRGVGMGGHPVGGMGGMGGVAILLVASCYRTGRGLPVA